MANLFDPRYLLILLFGCCLFASPVQAEVAITGTVERVLDGQTFQLKNNTTIRLAGVQTPVLPVGQPQYAPWPLAYEAKQALEEIILGEEIYASYKKANIDRYGNILAHVFVSSKDNIWVQGEMLKKGMARVQTFSHTRQYGNRMLALEENARRQELGIWGRSFYKVVPHTEAGEYEGRFQLIEGVVQNVATRPDIAYLNFSNDWKTDFTATISKKNNKLFTREGINVKDYQNKRVLIRGWIREENGPMIEITHPEQIQILDASTRGRP